MTGTTTTLPTGPLSAQLLETIDVWSTSQHSLIVTAARFADSAEWILAGSPTPAHWLAAVADVEACTAREWIRIGRQLRHLPATAAAFQTGAISYSKVRARRSLRSLTEFRLSRNIEVPPYEETGHTVTNELQLRCAPCHHQRHAA